MKRSTVLFLTLSAALFAGLAHLRADWLGGASDHIEPAVVDSPDRAVMSATWALRQNNGPPLQTLIRQP